MGFTAAELNPDLAVDPATGPGSPEENGGLDRESEKLAFKAKVDALIRVEQEAFDAWLVEDRLEALIDNALAVARATLAASAGMSEEDNPRSTIAMIDLGHRRAKPLVQALCLRRIGEPEIWSTYTWDIGFCDIVGSRSRALKSANSAQVNVTVEAFTLALSKPGFELVMWRE